MAPPASPHRAPAARRPVLSLWYGCRARAACFGALVIVLAAALSGCTGSPASPSPSSSPGTIQTAAACPTPTPVTMRSGSLFDTGGLSWYEYRLTPAGDGKIAASDVRFDHTIAVVNGITVNDDRITMKMSSPEMLVIMDKYYDPSSNVQVGSHMKTISGGMTPQNAGRRSGDLYRSHDIVAAYADGNWPLEDRGPETITIDGQSYDCTKYAIGEAGDHGTAWSCDGVPVPVKLETGSADGVQATWELIGRG